MVPRRVLKSQGTSLARSDKSEVEGPSQPGSQSSDDNQVTKLAIEMQREVLCAQSRADEATRIDSLLGQETSRGSTHCHHQVISGSSEEDRDYYDTEI